MSQIEAAAAPPYQSAEEVAGDDRYRLLRSRIGTPAAPVLLKVPARKPALVEDVAGLKREYEILVRPPIEAVTRALDLIVDDEHCALVLEDHDDVPLAAVLAARSVPVGWVLDYALQIVDALAGLHRAGIVHRGLSPRSVLVHPQSGRIRLADFADAARDAAEACAPLARHQYRTRLPYAAPEQTGRVNRGCDYRTDFYALGALLYELLTGRPPFVADDPLELMHAHLARQPVAPADLVAAVPAPLSEIVLKLLAKQPEERYQSARGLADDLQRCRREWTERGRVTPFQVGARDVSDRFAIPSRLFGRDAERRTLLAAFERAWNGPATLVLVEGPAGIGKTALIRELQAPVSRSRGHFVSGKFDQLSREVPYGALSQALRQRVQRILAGPADHQARERDRLAAALGAHASVIAEVVPEIETLLGRCRPAPVLDAAEAQNRFTLAFQNFVAALATAEAPLVIFLDDLHWADASTLQLLVPLLGSPQVRHVLVIGAARPAEPGAEPPVARLLVDAAAAGVPHERIELAPLSTVALEELVRAVLQLPADENAALARVLQAKTLGNPLFVTQVLATLHNDGLIAFDRDAWTWTCRLDGIGRVAIADNVVDLLARKLERLPAATQQVLTLAACVGNRFDARTLATVCERPLRTTLDELDPAVRAGLIAPDAANVYTFIHDRVQQAAYARIDPGDRPHVHLRVGRLLWGEHGAGGSDSAGFDGIFETVSHLNLGASLIDAPEERLALARLNLAAGTRAKAAAAYRAALGYFAAGRELLGPAHWQHEYELAFALFLENAQCDYLCGNFDSATQRFDALMRLAQTDFDRARVASLRAVQYENQARYDAALGEARTALGFLGVVLPAEPVATEQALQGEIDAIDHHLGPRRIGSLIDEPQLTDAQTLLVMRILTNAWASAYILGDATLARLISAILVRLSLQHGLAEESAYGFVTHAITAGPVRGDYDAAWEWGTLALAVVERLDARRLRAKVYQQFHAHVELWRRPFSRCVEHAHEACRSGLENGDFLYAAYGASTAAWPALAASQDLAQFERDFLPNLALLAQLKNTSFADALRLMIGWAGALQRAQPESISLSGPDFDEAQYVATYGANPFFSMFHAIARLHVCFTLDDAAGAARAADAVRATASSLVGMQWSVQFAFFNAMRLAVAFDRLAPAERVAAEGDLASARQSLAVLARSSRDNYQCFAWLLDAEHARIGGRALEALDFYERAVACADEVGHVQQQALANERCGRYFLERGNRKVAALYLQTALECYVRWGAHAKARRMRAAFHGLLSASGGALAGLAGAAIPAADAALDVARLGEVAAAIGATDELSAALRGMLATAIRTAGASHGVLIEVRDGDCLVIAEGGADVPDAVLVPGTRVDEAPLCCPPDLVTEVLRTGREKVLAGPALDERAAADPYLAMTEPKAVLCVPAMHQGRTAALLYLENRFARDAFGADRVQVIRILAAQAAILLASTRLVERFRAEMAERQRAEQHLRAIDQGLANVTGGDFFRALVRNIAQALQVRYAFVAECLHLDGPEGPAGGIARARAFWRGDDFGPNFEYKLAGTPCLEVLEGEMCHFADELRARFPADVGLVRWQAESYVGMPLLDSNERVIGHLVVIDTRPMPDATLAAALLRLSAGRAGAELERLKADEGLKHALAEVEELKNRLQEENVYLRRELIANVSHDLRSPLASLRGYLETLLIKEGSLSEGDRHAYLTIALRQAEQLQALISELFDLARLDFTGYRIAAEPMHLGELARDVAQRFQLAAADKGVELVLDVDDRLALVDADIALIERTIANLLDNALTHTPAGGRVRLAVQARPDGVVIDVSDTGTGIPAADLPRVFERFYRVDKARSLDKSGSGLGLAIVKRIVELHGSEIRVESAVGVGTRFWFGLRNTTRAG